jgi:hypothetical protein
MTATMLLLTILTLLSLASAFPTKPNDKVANTKHDDCISSNFNKPWILRDIFVWQPFPTNTTTNTTTRRGTAIGNINFLFFDVNKDLQMMTECDGALVDGATEDKNGGYTLCKNSTIGFKFSRDGEVFVERAYIDPW